MQGNIGDRQRRPSSSSVPGRWASLAALLSLLPLTACVTPRRPPRGAPISSSAPTRSAEPLSWEHMQEIEDWLDGPEARRRPQDVPAHELELAEGRIALARRDRGAVSEQVIGLRLDLARDGFRRVISDPNASPWEKDRAQDGLSKVAVLRSGPPTALPTPAAASAAGLPLIRPRSAWAARPPVSANLRPNRQPWTRITVHHSANAAAALGGPNPSAVQAAIQNIQKIHMENEGWGDIGYHFLIDPAGRLYQGRDLSWQGAHAGGANNVGNIGICLLGNFDVERPDARALATLERLIDALSRRHGIPRSAVKGHRDYKATACPGSHLAGWVENYARGRG